MGDHSSHHRSHETHTGEGLLLDNPSTFQAMNGMVFHFKVTETLLFDWWKTSTPEGMVACCFVVFLMALSYEALKFWRARLLIRARQMRYSSVRTATGVAGEPISTPDDKPLTTITYAGHLQQTLVFVVQVTLGYLLMLLFMYFNAWICIAVVLGAAAGYFFFGRHTTPAEIRSSDHCST